MKRNNKLLKLVSFIGLGVTGLGLTTGLSVGLTSCAQEETELFNFADESKTKITSLTRTGKNTEKLVIPKNVKEIAPGAFENLKGSKIKELDFSQCSRLTKLPKNAFNNSSNITTLLLPPKLTSIDEKQISSLTNIERINWPSAISVDMMIKATWKLPIFIPYCEENANLSLDVQGSRTRYDDGNGVKEYTISQKPNNPTIYLVPKQFSGISGIYNKFAPAKALYFQSDSSYTVISENCLRNSDLERIVLPSSITEIQGSNFWHNDNLIILESEDKFKNLTKVGSWNFNELKKLKYLDFSGSINGFTQTVNTCFYNLTNLEYLVLPNSFTNFNPSNPGHNMFFNGEWDSLTYMPMPKQFDFKATGINNGSRRCSGKLAFRTVEKNKVVYDDLYEDSTAIGIWVDGLSTKVNKPDMSKLPNVSFISYRDKTEYFTPKK